MIYVLKTLHFGTKYVTISALSIQVFFTYTVNFEELNQLLPLFPFLPSFPRFTLYSAFYPLFRVLPSIPRFTLYSVSAFPVPPFRFRRSVPFRFRVLPLPLFTQSRQNSNITGGMHSRQVIEVRHGYICLIIIQPSQTDFFGGLCSFFIRCLYIKHLLIATTFYKD